MEFALRDRPEENFCNAQWDSGQFTIVDMMFAFGQSRIQVWYRGPKDRPYSWPDIIGVQY